MIYRVLDYSVGGEPIVMGEFDDGDAASSFYVELLEEAKKEVGLAELELKNVRESLCSLLTDISISVVEGDLSKRSLA